MIVLPALQLRNAAGVQPGGQRQPEDPVTLAHAWMTCGFHRVHIVDLDAELETGSNAWLVEDIIRDGSIDVQVAGGIRTTEEVQRLFEAGASTVVVGARALDQP